MKVSICQRAPIAEDRKLTRTALAGLDRSDLLLVVIVILGLRLHGLGLGRATLASYDEGDVSLIHPRDKRKLERRGASSRIALGISSPLAEAASISLMVLLILVHMFWRDLVVRPGMLILFQEIALLLSPFSWAMMWRRNWHYFARFSREFVDRIEEGALRANSPWPPRSKHRLCLGSPGRTWREMLE